MQRYFSPHWYYAESAQQFAEDAANRPKWLQRYLLDARNFYGDNGSVKEDRSWPLTIKTISKLIENAELTREQIVILEFRFDMHQRIDAIICGKNNDNEDNAVLLEIKNWFEKGSKFDLALSSVPKNISMQINNEIKNILHPCVQVEGYEERLRVAQERKFIDQNNIIFQSAVYLPNAKRLSDEWTSILRDGDLKSYVYDQDKEHKLIETLKESVGYGSGISTMQKLIEISPMK